MLCHRIVMDFMSEVVFHQRHCQRSMATCLLRCISSSHTYDTANNSDINSNKLQQNLNISLLTLISEIIVTWLSICTTQVKNASEVISKVLFTSK